MLATTNCPYLIKFKVNAFFFMRKNHHCTPLIISHDIFTEWKMISEPWDTWNILRLEGTPLLCSGADEPLNLRDDDNTQERQYGHYKPWEDHSPRRQTTTLLCCIWPLGWHRRNQSCIKQLYPKLSVILHSLLNAIRFWGFQRPGNISLSL